MKCPQIRKIITAAFPVLIGSILTEPADCFKDRGAFLAQACSWSTPPELNRKKLISHQHHTIMLQALSKLKELKCWLWCGSMGKVMEKINQTSWLLWYYVYSLIGLSLVWKKSLLDQLRKFLFLKFSTRNTLLDFTTVFNTGRYRATTDLLISSISFCTSELLKAVETN